MLLESFTRHPCRSTADHIFKSVLCGRCGTVNYHPLLNIEDFKDFGGWKSDRGTTKLHARILGERVCRRRNQPCSLWEAQQAQLLSYQCIHIYIYIIIIIVIIIIMYYYCYLLLSLLSLVCIIIMYYDYHYYYYHYYYNIYIHTYTYIIIYNYIYIPIVSAAIHDFPFSIRQPRLPGPNLPPSGELGILRAVEEGMETIGLGKL